MYHVSVERCCCQRASARDGCGEQAPVGANPCVRPLESTSARPHCGVQGGRDRTAFWRLHAQLPGIPASQRWNESALSSSASPASFPRPRRSVALRAPTPSHPLLPDVHASRASFASATHPGVQRGEAPPRHLNIPQDWGLGVDRRSADLNPHPRAGGDTGELLTSREGRRTVSCPAGSPSTHTRRMTWHSRHCWPIDPRGWAPV